MHELSCRRFGPLSLALRICLASKVKLCSVTFLIGVISIFLAGAELLHCGIGDAADRGAKRLGADLMIVPAREELRLGSGLFGGLPVRLALPEGIEAAVSGVPGVRGVAPQYFLASARASCCDSGNLLLVGFDPDNDLTVLPWLRASGARLDKAMSAVVGGGVMKGEGATIRFYNSSFSVAARLEKSGMGYFDNAVFIPFAGLRAMESSSMQGGAVPVKIPWGRPSLLLLRLDPGGDRDAAARLIEGRIGGVRVLTMPELFREKREKMETIAGVERSMRVVAWLLAMLAAAALQLPWWRERRPLLGLMQCCGIGRWAILLGVAVETLLMTGIGVVVGSVGALLLLHLFTPYITAVLGIPLLLDAKGLFVSTLPGLWFGLAAAMTAGALLLHLPLLGREPAELMRRG